MKTNTNKLLSLLLSVVLFTSGCSSSLSKKADIPPNNANSNVDFKGDSKVTFQLTLKDSIINQLKDSSDTPSLGGFKSISSQSSASNNNKLNRCVASLYAFDLNGEKKDTNLKTNVSDGKAIFSNIKDDTVYSTTVTCPTKSNNKILLLAAAKVEKGETIVESKVSEKSYLYETAIKDAIQETVKEKKEILTSEQIDIIYEATSRALEKIIDTIQEVSPIIETENGQEDVSTTTFYNQVNLQLKDNQREIAKVVKVVNSGFNENVTLDESRYMLNSLIQKEDAVKSDSSTPTKEDYFGNYFLERFAEAHVNKKTWTIDQLEKAVSHFITNPKSKSEILPKLTNIFTDENGLIQLRYSSKDNTFSKIEDFNIDPLFLQTVFIDRDISLYQGITQENIQDLRLDATQTYIILSAFFHNFTIPSNWNLNTFLDQLDLGSKDSVIVNIVDTNISAKDKVTIETSIYASGISDFNVNLTYKDTKGKSKLISLQKNSEKFGYHYYTTDINDTLKGENFDATLMIVNSDGLTLSEKNISIFLPKTDTKISLHGLKNKQKLTLEELENIIIGVQLSHKTTEKDYAYEYKVKLTNLKNERSVYNHFYTNRLSLNLFRDVLDENTTYNLSVSTILTKSINGYFEEVQHFKPVTLTFEVTPKDTLTEEISTPETNLEFIPTTDEPIAGASCYWMENYSGKYKWVTPYSYMFDPSRDGKERCKQLDSCDGGDGLSGGGCYKWADSPTGNRYEWASPKSEPKLTDDYVAPNTTYTILGEGTLLTEEGHEYYRVAQFKRLGNSVEEIRKKLEEQCDLEPACVGYHYNGQKTNGRYLEGALLFDASIQIRSGWPYEIPLDWQNNGVRHSWRSPGDVECTDPYWCGSGKPSKNTSTVQSKGWENWTAVIKNTNSDPSFSETETEEEKDNKKTFMVEYMNMFATIIGDTIYLDYSFETIQSDLQNSAFKYTGKWLTEQRFTYEDNISNINWIGDFNKEYLIQSSNTTEPDHDAAYKNILYPPELCLSNLCQTDYITNKKQYEDIQAIADYESIYNEEGDFIGGKRYSSDKILVEEFIINSITGRKSIKAFYKNGNTKHVINFDKSGVTDIVYYDMDGDVTKEINIQKQEFSTIIRPESKPDVKEDRERQNAVHNGPGGDAADIWETELKWECDSCNGKDLSDAKSVNNVAVNLNQGICYNITDKTTSITDKKDCSGTWRQFTEDEDTDKKSQKTDEKDEDSNIISRMTGHSYYSLKQDPDYYAFIIEKTDKKEDANFLHFDKDTVVFDDGESDQTFTVIDKNDKGLFVLRNQKDQSTFTFDVNEGNDDHTFKLLIKEIDTGSTKIKVGSDKKTGLVTTLYISDGKESVTIDYDPKKHFIGSSYKNEKQDKERQNAGHNGLGGDASEIWETDLKWECDSCNGKDLSDAKSINNIAVNLNQGICYNITDKTTSITDKKDCSGTWRQFTEDEDTD